MSLINVNGVIKNHHVKSSVFTPLVEAIVNSIEAINDRKIKNGEIKVVLKREHQKSLLEKVDNKKSQFTNIEIIDNGIGFSEKNRNSFDTFYSTYKLERGGKGFGRFMYKKYFREIEIESIYRESGTKNKRQFRFGDENEIIDKKSEKVEKVDDSENIRTIVRLNELKSGTYPKEVETISRTLLEKILPYFITENYTPPNIIICEEGGEEILLNDYVKNSKYICNEKTEEFTLKNKSEKKDFQVKIFKIFSPGSQSSKVILTADKREVTEVPMHEYVPEFKEEFVDYSDDIVKNFILKAYVFGEYLNKNVTSERDNFLFEKEDGLFYPFSQNEIEKKTVDIVEKVYKSELKSRRDKKINKVNDFLKEHPWYKSLKQDLDWNEIPMNPSDNDINQVASKAKYQKEKSVQKKVNKILDNFDKEIPEKINEVFSAIDEIKKSELVHYISLRKVYLEVLKKTLEIKDINKKHEKEDLLHSIIFPMRKDSDQVGFDEHNLWILDERLNFVEYLRSDMPLSEELKRRPDLLFFNNRSAFRGGTEPSNPITIFEFKKPGRDDFVNKSSKEDPYEQILNYVEAIRAKKFTTPKDREIEVGEGTPYYGYIIADKSSKIESWLVKKDFKPLPDGQRWFKWQSSYNLYCEFISWNQLLKDAEMRNKLFFNRLGI